MSSQCMTFSSAFTINLLEARIVRCSCFAFENIFFHVLPSEGPSPGTMSTPVALFLYAMPGLATMSMVACGLMKSPAAKSGASRSVTKKKEKATGAKVKTSPNGSSIDTSDVEEQSANTASKSDLQATIAKLKYHANPDKNKKGSADDKRNAKDLLAHYKKIQSSSARADFVEKLKRYGIKGMPKMLEVVDSRMDVDDSLALHVVKYLSPQQIFIAEGLPVS